MGQLFEIVARILRRGQRAGELREDLDPDIACFVFIGGLDVVLTSRVLEVIEIEPGTPQEAQYHLKVARTLVDLFLNGARAVEGSS